VGAVRILLIEDDRLVAGMIRDTLAAEGWEVTVREDGWLGLAEIEGETPYNLIITDYELSGVDGATLSRATRTALHRRYVPVVMFTASPVEQEALAAGADLFLRKPQDVGVLIEAIRGLLIGSRVRRT
jgi:DNA-binding response OmpR family regulator